MTLRTLKTWTLLLALLALLIPAAGCGPEGKDAQEIRAAWKKLTYSWVLPDGPAAGKLQSQRTVDHYQKVLKHALESPASTVSSLPPTQMYEVIRMRSRMSKADMKKMDGRAYYTYSVTSGWRWEIDDGWDIRDIKVNKDTATAVVFHPKAEHAYKSAQTLDSRVWGTDPRAPKRREYMGFFDGRRSLGPGKPPPTYLLRWTKENGVWTMDETSFHPDWDQDIREEAKGAEMSVKDYLLLFEGAQLEKEIPKSIFDAPKK